LDQSKVLRLCFEKKFQFASGLLPAFFDSGPLLSHRHASCSKVGLYECSFRPSSSSHWFAGRGRLSFQDFATPRFDIGAPVVYQREEVSTHPVADALNVRPSERGEFYYYSLVNYLRVTQVLDDGRIIAVTRDNKRLCLSPNDSQLRKARFTERFIYRWRFPHLSA
jgi:hypothetical protein